MEVIGIREIGAIILRFLAFFENGKVEYIKGTSIERGLKNDRQ